MKFLLRAGVPSGFSRRHISQPSYPWLPTVRDRGEIYGLVVVPTVLHPSALSELYLHIAACSLGINTLIVPTALISAVTAMQCSGRHCLELPAPPCAPLPARSPAKPPFRHQLQTGPTTSCYRPDFLDLRTILESTPVSFLKSILFKISISPRRNALVVKVGARLPTVPNCPGRLQDTF